jgi:hypothetical protein
LDVTENVHGRSNDILSAMRQVTKLCIIPTVMAIDYFKSGKTSSFRIYLSIALLLLGVGIATVTDVDVSAHHRTDIETSGMRALTIDERTGIP